MRRAHHAEASPFPALINLRAFAIAAIVIATAAGIPLTPGHEAWADDANAKHAIPTLEKSVGANGRSFGKQVSVHPGEHAFYQLIATLPEEAQKLESLTYTVYDTPDTRMHLEKGSIQAWIECERNGKTTTLSPEFALDDAEMVIELGDLKAVCPDLSDDDVVVIRYRMRTPRESAREEFPNVATLAYECDGKAGETVGSKASVIVQPGSPRNPALQSTSPFPQTGDAPLWLVSSFAGIAVLAASTALAAARKGCDRKSRAETGA